MKSNIANESRIHRDDIRNWLESSLSQATFIYKLERLSDAFGLREEHIIGFLYLPFGQSSSIGSNLVREIWYWTAEHADISPNNPTEDKTIFSDPSLCDG